MSQKDVVQSFTYGAWTAHVIDRSARNMGSGWMVRIDHPNQLNTSWPIKYPDGHIAYDDIHDPPEDCQRAVKAAYRWINEV